MRISQRSVDAREALPLVELLYALMYLPLFIAGTAFVVWYELTRKAVENSHTTADTVYAIIIDIGYVGVADAAVTFGVVEGGVATMILARRWLERMQERDLARGVVQGNLERQRKWEGWNGRRLQAEEEGREFNEPPPSLYDDEDED